MMPGSVNSSPSPMSKGTAVNFELAGIAGVFHGSFSQVEHEESSRWALRQGDKFETPVEAISYPKLTLHRKAGG